MNCLPLHVLDNGIVVHLGVDAAVALESWVLGPGLSSSEGEAGKAARQEA